MGFAHFFRKRDFFDGSRTYGAFCLFLFPDADGRKQRTDTDTGSAQIVDFVDFQRRINFIRTGQNICHFIRSYGVQSATEGIQLDQIQIFRCFYIIRRCVQAGMIHPLVHNI